jgi:hypothetical protein
MKRHATIRRSPYTHAELGLLVRARDEDPTYDRMPCGCAWWSGKGGTSRWEHTAQCGPWPPPYPSKQKHRHA